MCGRPEMPCSGIFFSWLENSVFEPAAEKDPMYTGSRGQAEQKKAQKVSISLSQYRSGPSFSYLYNWRWLLLVCSIVGEVDFWIFHFLQFAIDWHNNCKKKVFFLYFHVYLCGNEFLKRKKSLNRVQIFFFWNMSIWGFKKSS
jgi:hypothetical protein